jgi:hypothetical protein
MAKAARRIGGSMSVSDLTDMGDPPYTRREH